MVPAISLVTVGTTTKLVIVMVLTFDLMSKKLCTF